MIVETAVKYNGNNIISAKTSHSSIIFKLIKEYRESRPLSYEEGFITDKGEFLNRTQAYSHAAKCGQVKSGRGALKSHMINLRGS